MATRIADQGGLVEIPRIGQLGIDADYVIVHTTIEGRFRVFGWTDMSVSSGAILLFLVL